MFFGCFVLCIVIIKTQNRRPNNIQKTAPQSYRTEIKILPFPLLFGSEPRGPGVTLLGWPKSIYYVMHRSQSGLNKPLLWKFLEGMLMKFCFTGPSR